METEESFILDKDGNKIYGSYYAKQACNKCYGRGYSGIDSQTRAKIPCRCLKFLRRKDENFQDSSNTTKAIN